MKTALQEWERVEKEYRRMQAAVAEKSQAYLYSIRQQARERREAFVTARRQGGALINTNPLIPRAAHI